jgi:hypothetical protein
MKYWLKRCPHCNGDLREGEDQYGMYIDCVQCGYTLKAAEEAALITATAFSYAAARALNPTRETVGAGKSR